MRRVVPKLTLRAIAGGVRAYLQRGPRRASRIGRLLKEEIVLRVSAVNECPVCSSIHERLAERLGIPPDEIARAQQGSARDDRSEIALRYAEARTLGRETSAIVAEFERMFDREERIEVRAIVDLFTFNNAFNNTWESWLPGALARRERFRR
jgi:AhpD family alkylhydroperoxidase